MAFLPCSKIMLSDGTFKRIDQLTIGESIKSYVTSSETSTLDGVNINTIGSYTTSSVSSIDSSSLVSDYTDDNAQTGNAVAGLFSFGLGVLPDRVGEGKIYDETKFSVDTEIYTEHGFVNLLSNDPHITNSTYVLDSMQETEFANDVGWKKVNVIEFYSVNDKDLDYSASYQDFDKFILDSTPLYKIQTDDNNPYIMGNFIINN